MITYSDWRTANQKEIIKPLKIMWGLISGTDADLTPLSSVSQLRVDWPIEASLLLKQEAWHVFRNPIAGKAVFTVYDLMGRFRWSWDFTMFVELMLGVNFHHQQFYLLMSFVMRAHVCYFIFCSVARKAWAGGRLLFLGAVILANTLTSTWKSITRGRW